MPDRDLILIRGAGDLASGIALRLFRSGFCLVMTDLLRPSSIRRTVCFSETMLQGSWCVEDVQAQKAENMQDALSIVQQGKIPIVADDMGTILHTFAFVAVVDARIAKRNIDTKITDAPVVIGVGPGFYAGVDCHAVIETQRGHYLGRVLYKGEAQPNTGIPGEIGGYTTERLLRAPVAGTFQPHMEIGARVLAGQRVASVGETSIPAEIDGILRGILPAETSVHAGMKCGDIDPRCEVAHCFCASDKALAVGGGVLEALLALRAK